MKKEIRIINGETDEEELHELPAKYEVCDRCLGHGVHDHPAFNGITMSEWEEWDYDDRENYMNGAYSVTCTECEGMRVIPVVDEKFLTKKQKEIYEKWLEEKYYDACYAAEVAAERAMGA